MQTHRSKFFLFIENFFSSLSAVVCPYKNPQVGKVVESKIGCVEIMRMPGVPELCFFVVPDEMPELTESERSLLLPLEENHLLSLRKHLIESESLRVTKHSHAKPLASFLRKLRGIPFCISFLINLLLLGWLALPLNSNGGWHWPQAEWSYEVLLSLADAETRWDALQRVIPLDLDPDQEQYRMAVNAAFLVLCCANILVTFLVLFGWLYTDASVIVYQLLLEKAYEDAKDNSSTKLNLLDLNRQARSGGGLSRVLFVFGFWWRVLLLLFAAATLFFSPLFSVCFCLDIARFGSVNYMCISPRTFLFNFMHSTPPSPFSQILSLFRQGARVSRARVSHCQCYLYQQRHRNCVFHRCL